MKAGNINLIHYQSKYKCSVRWILFYLVHFHLLIKQRLLLSKMLRANLYSIAMKIKMEIKTKLIELFYFIFVKYGSGWVDKFNYICCKLCNNAIKQLFHTGYSTVNVILKE